MVSDEKTNLIHSMGMKYDEAVALFSAETLSSMAMSYAVGGGTNNGCTQNGCSGAGDDTQNGCVQNGCGSGSTGGSSGTSGKSNETTGNQGGNTGIGNGNTVTGNQISLIAGCQKCGCGC